MNVKLMTSSQRDDWETPQELFEKLEAEFRFTLDAAASAENAKCERYFTKEDNGLEQSWDGERVWCNPPYGRKVGEWVKKAAESKAVTVMLLFARTDTTWFHEYVLENPRAEVRFVRGRIRFVGAKDRAPIPSMIVVFRNGGSHEIT
jgi:site-specific DNA-methyltransferase (adenine-specific)